MLLLLATKQTYFKNTHCHYSSSFPSLLNRDENDVQCSHGVVHTHCLNLLNESSSFNETFYHKKKKLIQLPREPKNQKNKRIKRLAKARWSRMHGKNKKKKGIQLPSKQAKKERKKESKKEAWELLLWMVWHTAFFLVFFLLPGDTTTYIHT